MQKDYLGLQPMWGGKCQGHTGVSTEQAKNRNPETATHLLCWPDDAQVLREHGFREHACFSTFKFKRRAGQMLRTISATWAALRVCLATHTHLDAEQAEHQGADEHDGAEEAQGADQCKLRGEGQHLRGAGQHQRQHHQGHLLNKGYRWGGQMVALFFVNTMFEIEASKECAG